MLKTSASWLLEGTGDPNAGTEVKVVGRIGAGAEILPEYEQIPEDGLFEISVPFATPADTIAFEVEGDSMWPRYDSGDVVICWRQSEDAENVVGREAAVRTRDGRRYLKRVRRGAVTGTYDLESHNAAPIRGVEIVWAAAIQAVVRAGQWQRIASNARREACKVLLPLYWYNYLIQCVFLPEDAMLSTSRSYRGFAHPGPAHRRLYGKGARARICAPPDADGNSLSGLAAAEPQRLIAVAEHLLGTSANIRDAGSALAAKSRPERQSGAAAGPHSAARRAPRTECSVCRSSRAMRQTLDGARPALRPQPHHDIDLDDFIALRRLELAGEIEVLGHDIRHAAGVFVIIMAMIGRVRIENRLAALYGKAADDPTSAKRLRTL